MGVKKKVLNAQGQAALASGASQEQLMADPSLTEEVSTEAPEQQPKVGEKPAETPKVEAKPVETPKEPEASASANISDLMQIMDKVSDLSAQVATLTKERDTAQAKVSDMEATHGAMAKIVAAGVNRMQIGCGGVATDLSNMNPATLVEAYQSTEQKFLKRFPVGGVAEVATEKNLEANGSQTESGIAAKPGMTL